MKFVCVVQFVVFSLTIGNTYSDIALCAVQKWMVIRTAEYIDKEKLIARLKVSPLFLNIRLSGSFILDGVIDLINKQSVADVVKIVRCKNCKHFDIEEGDALGTCMGKFACISLGGELYPEPDYFCPYGERRTE